MATRSDHLDTARRYLAAIEAGDTGDALAAFFTADAVQEEFPNLLLPTGTRRDLAAILDAAERGRQILTAQSFEILSATADSDRVALEVRWEGTLAVPVATLPAGGRMRARFATVLEFRDGRIAAQRNYDCFDPW